MKATLIWKDAMNFDGTSGPHAVPMDAKTPIGKDSAATPKELVAMGLGGCTAMDVIALLKKYKQLPESFLVDVDIQTSTGGYPAVFEKALIKYIVSGNIDSEKLLEAVRLSQTKYCGVSAMFSKVFPIEYQVILNDEDVGRGFANFEINKNESL